MTPFLVTGLIGAFVLLAVGLPAALLERRATRTPKAADDENEGVALKSPDFVNRANTISIDASQVEVTAFYVSGSEAVPHKLVRTTKPLRVPAARLATRQN